LKLFLYLLMLMKVLFLKMKK